ncbi:glycosyltransferase [Paraliobacillus ryukyuensis]|uniref:glycosyltransferase n=1 Tax=Paraliobacillus ryukyuensis TaxID=200904 RepID=UPI0009A82B60|nr:glycosyltransferase [Paraliobacillus ryukyuensis]
MKIIFFHHSSTLSGAQKSLKYLLQEIKQYSKSDELELWVVKDGPGVKNLSDLGIKTKITSFVVPFHGSTVTGMTSKLLIRNVLTLLPSILFSYIYFKKNKPDIVHLNSTSMFPAAIGAKLARVKRVVTHVREPLLNNIFGNILKYFSNKFSDAFIGISEYDLNSTRYKKVQSKVVYNFVNFNTNINQNYSISKDNSLKMLYLGRIIKQNGVEELVREFSSLSNHKVILTIAGFNYKMSDYEKKILSLIEGDNRITTIEYVDDVQNLILENDIMVCPFIEPHFSRSIVEGAMLKKPAISRNIPSPNEIISHNNTGWLYDSKEEFINQIEYLVKNKPIISKAGDAAYHNAINLFDSKANAKATYDFIISEHNI